jgi:hypothetical protein
MTQYKKSVINMGIRLYNKLPDRIKMVDNYKSFKREIKLILLRNSFYSQYQKKNQLDAQSLLKTLIVVLH